MTNNARHAAAVASFAGNEHSMRNSSIVTSRDVVKRRERRERREELQLYITLPEDRRQERGRQQAELSCAPLGANLFLPEEMPDLIAAEALTLWTAT